MYDSPALLLTAGFVGFYSETSETLWGGLKKESEGNRMEEAIVALTSFVFKVGTFLLMLILNVVKVIGFFVGVYIFILLFLGMLIISAESWQTRGLSRERPKRLPPNHNCTNCGGTGQVPRTPDDWDPPGASSYVPCYCTDAESYGGG